MHVIIVYFAACVINDCNVYFGYRLNPFCPSPVGHMFTAKLYFGDEQNKRAVFCCVYINVFQF